MTRNRQQIFPLRPFATLGRRLLRDKLYRRYVRSLASGFTFFFADTMHAGNEITSTSRFPDGSWLA